MIIERIRLKAELKGEQYEKALAIIEKLKERFPNVLVRQMRTQEKLSFIDVYLGERFNFDLIIGKREKPFIIVEMEGSKAKYAFQIMRAILDEINAEYSLDFDDSNVYTALREKIRLKSLFEFLNY